MTEKSFVKSISYSQEEILSNIIKLYNNGKAFQCDPCYSTGNFYKSGEIPKPEYKMDLIPSAEGVQQVDCRKLPFEDSSISSIIFDPPFLATKGPSLSKMDDSNKINKRFGVYPTEHELFQFYWDSIKEFSRVLEDKGLLVIKCQDKVSSNKQYISHVALINYCEAHNFYCEDIFILLAQNRLVADWQIKNQRRSRKYHCYFLVMRKNDSRLKSVLKDMNISSI